VLAGQGVRTRDGTTEITGHDSFLFQPDGAPPVKNNGNEAIFLVFCMTIINRRGFPLIPDEQEVDSGRSPSAGLLGRGESLGLFHGEEGSGIKPRFCATPAAFRAWLKKEKSRADKDRWVGFYRKAPRPAEHYHGTNRWTNRRSACVGGLDAFGDRRRDQLMNSLHAAKAKSAGSIINIGRWRNDRVKSNVRRQPAGATPR